MSEKDKANLPTDHNYFPELRKKLSRWKAILKENWRIARFSERFVVQIIIPSSVSISSRMMF